MYLNQLEIEGYRSIKDLWLKLGRVNVIIGPNGCGKSNLYRALWLLHAAAQGDFAQSIASEGGMPSALWAGAKSDTRARMRISVRLEQIEYEFACGIPIPGETAFNLDPDIKSERVWIVNGSKKVELLKRVGQMVTAHDETGRRIEFPAAVPKNESVLSELREPHKFPELSRLRQEFLHWRFYHQFRTDMSSPIRQAQIGVRTERLHHDGRDLAAALQTIREVGDSHMLDEFVELAFPGSRLSIDNHDGQFSVSMHMPGVHRSFAVRELSDGTLQYLCLLAALLSPRPPSFIALNEPETSVHPDLYDALARLIGNASQSSQIWVTTHATELAERLLEHTGSAPTMLEKVSGATKVKGQKLSPDVD